jgi:amino acid transporter
VSAGSQRRNGDRRQRSCATCPQRPIVTILVLIATSAACSRHWLDSHACCLQPRLMGSSSKRLPACTRQNGSVNVGAGTRRHSMLLCLLPLDTILRSVAGIGTLTRSIPQVIALLVLRRRRPDIPRPFRMWLYPVAALVTDLSSFRVPWGKPEATWAIVQGLPTVVPCPRSPELTLVLRFTRGLLTLLLARMLLPGPHLSKSRRVPASAERFLCNREMPCSTTYQVSTS